MLCSRSVLHLLRGLDLPGDGPTCDPAALVPASVAAGQPVVLASVGDRAFQDHDRRGLGLVLPCVRVRRQHGRVSGHCPRRRRGVGLEAQEGQAGLRCSGSSSCCDVPLFRVSGSLSRFPFPLLLPLPVQHFLDGCLSALIGAEAERRVGRARACVELNIDLPHPLLPTC